MTIVPENLTDNKGVGGFSNSTIHVTIPKAGNCN